MSAIITQIKFPFKRRDNPTVVCALLISYALRQSDMIENILL